MKKNWIIILSAALLVCLLLTGCGGTKSSVSPTFAPPVPNQEPVAVPAPGNNNAPDAFLYTQTLGNGLVVGISSNGMSNYTLTLRGADVQDRLKDIPQLRDYLSNIKSLRLEQGVREVNEKAFKDWTGLTEIYIGDDVAVIGDYAFSGCTALTDVSIRSDRLETIGQYAFEGCTALKDISFGDSVRTIGAGALARCTALKDVSLGAGIESMDLLVFEGDTALENFKIASDVPDGVLQGCTSLKILRLEGASQRIGARAFEGCTSLTSLSWAPGIREIGKSAFAKCSSLDFTHWPESIISVGDSAFEECTKLTKLTIPATMTSIGSAAFSGCSSITDLTFDKRSDDLMIGDSAFAKCARLTSVVFPEGVTTVGESAFSECSALSVLILPKSLRRIGPRAFEKTRLITYEYRGTRAEWTKLVKDFPKGWATGLPTSAGRPMKYSSTK